MPLIHKNNRRAAIGVGPSSVIIVLLLASQMAKGDDLIVNGTTTTVLGGVYNVVYVTNGGNLTVNGALTANSVSIVNGSLTVNGALTADTVSIVNGAADIRSNLATSGDITVNMGVLRATGTNNAAGSFVLDEGATASLLGTWVIESLTVRSNGVLSPVVYDINIPQSGRLSVSASDILIEQGGLVNGNYAGNDPRGRAGSFADAGGGGHGGDGAHGWWDASTQGRAFGENYTFQWDMGSAGGRMGGGGIALMGDVVTINGRVSANGSDGWYVQFQYAPGGGSGGTILIKADTLILTGTLSCNGGNGDSSAGPGGGGRIKVFYSEGGGTNLLARCSVAPGPNHPNKGPAKAGTIWFDAIPETPNLIAPASGETVPGSGTTFRFRVRDGSVATDGRDDMLFCTIELSTNGFATIAHRFDQEESLSGWNMFSYRDGDEAVFTAPAIIPEGSYRWRAIVRDRSLSGEFSEERIVHVGQPTYIDGSSLEIDMAIRLRFQSQHRKYRLQTSPDLQTWNDSEIVINGDGTLIEVYLPVAADNCHYRLLEL